MDSPPDLDAELGAVPDFKDREHMWPSLAVEQVATASAVDAYVAALQAVYANGTVRFGTFEIDPHMVFDWYLARSQLHEMGFFREFWSVDQARQFAPEPLAELNFFSFSTFTRSTPFTLAGELAWTLSKGGAYKRHPSGPVDAVRIAEAAAHALVRDDYDNVLVYYTHLPWSGFFFDVAWDNTWVVAERRQRRIHCLMATDTD